MKHSAPAQSPASVGPFFNTPLQRTQLARERFFEQGQRPTGMVPEAVIQSWTRCLADGLQPQQRPEFEPVTRARAKAVQERGQPLLQSAAPELDQLDAMLASTGCKTLLTDRDGIVLRATPANAGAGALLDSIGRVGVYLGEPNFGSTAPGISLSAAQDCAVAGAEHYFGVLQSLYCAAAPVRDPLGRVVGVLDVSIEGRPFAFDALALVRLCTAGIENRLLSLQAGADVVLCFQTDAALLGTPLEGRAVVSGGGRLLGMNAAASRLLQLDGVASGNDVHTLLGLTPAAIDRLRSRSQVQQPQAHHLPSGLRVWLRAWRHAEPAAAVRRLGSATPAASLGANPRPAASLRATSDQLISDTLRDCQGNIAQAARQLGVSRGLLYRRLQRRAGAD